MRKEEQGVRGTKREIEVRKTEERRDKDLEKRLKIRDGVKDQQKGKLTIAPREQHLCLAKCLPAVHSPPPPATIILFCSVGPFSAK